MACEAGVTSSQDLLALASQRLDRALACGGNAVVIDSRPECPLHNAGVLLPTMLAALNASDDKAIAARIGTLGLQILPLLKALNRELALGLSLPEIQRQLQQRAQVESGMENRAASSGQTLRSRACPSATGRYARHRLRTNRRPSPSAIARRRVPGGSARRFPAAVWRNKSAP